MAPTHEVERSDMNGLKRRRDRSDGIVNRTEGSGPYRRFNLRDNRRPYDGTPGRYNKYPRRSQESSGKKESQSPPRRSSRRYIPKPASPRPVAVTTKNWADINESSNDDELWELLKLEPSQSSGPVTRSKTPVKQMEKSVNSTSFRKEGQNKGRNEDDESFYHQFKNEIPLAEVGNLESVFKTPSTSRGMNNFRRGRQQAGSSLPSNGSPARGQRDLRSRNYFSSPVSTRSNNSSRMSSYSSRSSGRSGTKTMDEMETDIEVLKRKQKQLDFGKNTIGYQNYITLTPKGKRVRGDPVTPDKFIKYSRRSWDMQVRNWRRKLHSYDPSGSFDSDFENVEDVDVSDILSDLSFDSKLDGCSSPAPSSAFEDCPPISSSEIGDLEFDNLIHNQVPSSGPMDSSDALSTTPFEYHFGLTEMEEADFLN